MKIQLTSTLLFISFATFVLTACNPTKTQLAKEKERTEQTIKETVAPMQATVNQLQTELKIAQLKAQLDVAKLRLAEIEKPKEFKTQAEQADEINSLSASIEDLQNQINAAANTATTSDSTAH